MQPSNRVEIRRGHSSPSLHLRRKGRSVLIRTKVEKAGVVWGGGSGNGKAWRPDGIKILYTCRANFPGCVGCHPPVDCALYPHWAALLFTVPRTVGLPSIKGTQMPLGFGEEM